MHGIAALKACGLGAQQRNSLKLLSFGGSAADRSIAVVAYYSHW